MNQRKSLKGQKRRYFVGGNHEHPLGWLVGLRSLCGKSSFSLLSFCKCGNPNSRCETTHAEELMLEARHICSIVNGVCGAPGHPSQFCVLYCINAGLKLDGPLLPCNSWDSKICLKINKKKQLVSGDSYPFARSELGLRYARSSIIILRLAGWKMSWTKRG